MKRIITILFLVSLISCAENKSTEKKTGKDQKSDTTAANANTNNPNPAEDELLKAELEKLAPLTLEQLEKLAPAELLGVARTGVSSNANIGTGMATAVYPIEGAGDVELTIIDCAGPGGAGAYAMLYGDALNQDKTEGDEYTKTIDLNGSKAIEQGYTNDPKGSLTWFNGKRFLITLEGNNLAILKQASKTINIK